MIASIASSTLSILLLIFYAYFADCLFPKSLLMILIFLVALATTILSSSIICCSPKLHSNQVSPDFTLHNMSGLEPSVRSLDCKIWNIMNVSRLRCLLMEARAAPLLEIS